MMLEELQRRNYSEDTIRHYIRTVEEFARLSLLKIPYNPGRNHTGKSKTQSACGLPELMNENPKFTDVRT
jgi:hypothetical protein